MAMLPEVHVSLDRPTIQHIHQLFLPLVPGGTLVLGLILTHPHSAALAAVQGLRDYQRIALIVFFSYSAGLILYAASGYFASILSLSVATLYYRILKKTTVRNNLKFSQNRVWRTVAAKFLDTQLAPPPPPGGSSTTTALPFPPNTAPQPVLQHDFDWNDWYNVLQDYLLRGVQILSNDVLFFWTMVQATGWAFLVLSLDHRRGRHHHWLALLLLPVILISALIQFLSFYGYFKYDRLIAADFTARLLTEIRAREDAAHKTVAPASGP
jgi:hypothetical protein